MLWISIFYFVIALITAANFFLRWPRIQQASNLNEETPLLVSNRQYAIQPVSKLLLLFSLANLFSTYIDIVLTFLSLFLLKDSNLQQILSSLLIFFSWVLISTVIAFVRSAIRNGTISHYTIYIPVFFFCSTFFDTFSFFSQYWDGAANFNVLRTVALINLFVRMLFLWFVVVYILHNRGLLKVADTSENSRNISTWNNSREKILKLAPFLWPKKNSLKLVVLLCFMLLLGERIVNIVVPLAYKYIVDQLAYDPKTFAWLPVLYYVSFRFFQGSNGLLGALRSWFWIPVSQYTSRKISVKMLAHLHDLGLEFHLRRKTGEVLRVMDRGTSSVGSLLSYILFNILPIFFDIFAAIVVFVVMFDWIFGIIIFMSIFTYIFLTVWITEWRTKFRREMVELDNAYNARYLNLLNFSIYYFRAVDSLLNFETVKYFNNAEFEVQEYENAIVKYQAADFKSLASLNVLNLSQNLVITVGLLCGSLLCVFRISNGQSTLSDFILFMTYSAQLYQPLNWFGTFYRMIQQNFIDMEKMF
ncbi:Homocysteine S-methyltransferase 1, partial [Clydaea vesicula]